MQTNSLDIEKATLGVMLTYPDEDFSELVPDDFYDATYSKIASAILGMKSEGINIDLVTVYEALKPLLTPTQLAELSDGVYTSTSIKQYISTLKKYRRNREVTRFAGELLTLSDGEPSKLIEYADKLTMISSIGSDKEGSVTYDDVNSAYEQVVSRFGKRLYGYSWGEGLSFLDDITKGIVKKRVYRIGAPSNTGKTQLIYNLIPELLKQKKENGEYIKVLFFTLENTKEDTLVSIMCNHSGLNANKVNSGDIDGNWEYLQTLENRLYIVDDIYELGKIFSKTISIKPDVVILDYVTHIQLANSRGAFDKYDVYAESVPKFAKRHNVAWIDLNNLPKNLQLDEEIRATPGFFGSSLLMNNCDVAIHLMRNKEFKKTKGEVLSNPMAKPDDKTYFKTRNCLDLLVTKNRWGSVYEERTYGINFDSGGKWRELSQNDLNQLWAKYG